MDITDVCVAAERVFKTLQSIQHTRKVNIMTIRRLVAKLKNSPEQRFQRPRFTNETTRMGYNQIQTLPF